MDLPIPTEAEPNSESSYSPSGGRGYYDSVNAQVSATCACPDCMAAFQTRASGDDPTGAAGVQGYAGVPYYVDAVLNQSNSFWGSNTVTFSFLQFYPGYYNDAYASQPTYFESPTQFTAAQRAAAREIFAMYSEFVPLNFVEVTDNGPSNKGQIGLVNSNQPSGVGGFAWYPGSAEYQGDVWINSDFSYNLNPVKGNYGYLTLLHEIGHALGLKHPGNYNAGGGGTEGPYLPAGEDNRQYTVMSYYGHPLLAGIEPVTPLLYDIAALQAVYGANLNTRSGNTSYTFSNSTEIRAIWDGGGTDTFDASNQSAKVWIDLGAGKFSSIGTGGQQLNNIAIAFNCVIENATGGSGADSIVGNSIANVLRGGNGNDSLSGLDGNDTLYGDAGSDTLIGGNGTDTAVYSGNFSQYTFRWNGSAYTITDNRGGAPDGVDTVSQMEAYQFADRTATSITHDTGTGWLTSAKGSTWGMFWDPSNVQGWSSYTESYNGSGQTLTQIGLYDDGTGWGNFWDPTNVANFTFYQEHYVVGGARDAQGGTYDNGTGWALYWDVNNLNNWVSYQEQFVVGGAKSAEGGTYDDGRGWAKYWDPTNANNWSFYQEQLNTSGQKTGEGGTYDDGRGWSKFWDPTNANNWSFYQEQLNTSGQKTAEGGTYDDGRGWSKFWDPTNAANWSFYEQQLNTSGQVTAEGGIYDDNRRWEKFWDRENAQAWERYEQYYNSSGQLTGRTWYWDNGTSTTENFFPSGFPVAPDASCEDLATKDAEPQTNHQSVLSLITLNDADYWLI